MMQYATAFMQQRFRIQHKETCDPVNRSENTTRLSATETD